jgi:adenylate cyclase
LTVLVADVVGSPELFGRLGVDRADDARRALFTAFAAAIAAGDGVLIKTMGDGCLASFGSAADAVTAAVALQRAVGGLRDHKMPGLSLRVGVAVGDVTGGASGDPCARLGLAGQPHGAVRADAWSTSAASRRRRP